MDLAKYRSLFLEEARDHLSELSGALLALEKDPGRGEAIDLAFRMAHSVKGMAGSLGYDAITELAHKLEDRLAAGRAAGRVDVETGLDALFQGLVGLERMVAVVDATGEPPAPDPRLLEQLAAAAQAEPEEPPAGAQAAARPGAPADPPPQPAAPAPSVRVRTETLDRFLSAVGEVILTSRQVRTAADGEGLAPTATLSTGFDRMDRAVGELQRRALHLRTAPLLRAMEPLPRLARELALQTGKRAEVELRGAELELDRSILDRVGDPLVHLVRNAVDHGIESPAERRRAGKPETGRIVIDARRERDSIRISVTDDGAGIDLDAVRRRAVEVGQVHSDLAEDLPPDEIAALVFRPGVSTRGGVSDISGRGVGMDAVKATVEALGGRVELESQRALGTTTCLVVPVTAAVQRVLLVGIGAETVAIPIGKVERIVEVDEAALEHAGAECFALIDDEPVPVLDLPERLGLRPASARGVTPLLLADVRGERVALRVDGLVGQQEIYVKPVPRLLGTARALAGLTILGDGSPVFAIDVNQLL